MKGEIMNRDDIIRMAREADASHFAARGSMGIHFKPESLERFFHMAQAAEREACAKVCEVLTPTDINGVCPVADAIRARGQT